ncbi:MAG: rhodanese [Gammaproteobacteria bacterium]|nr:rhodanese [Gammaproteobacteria bacterium]
MKIYLVGGAVRDRLLDLPVQERDWVVAGADEAEMLAAGFTRVDADFPVFLHPKTGEEYALARTEEKVGPGYKGFRIHAGPDVSLEQDLLRRDLTINALAMDEQDRLIDVCNGRDDLDEGLLRHITPAFVEDPVRLLRIARFAAKLGRWGFRIAHGTHGLMQKMARDDDLLSLTRERVFQEMWKALQEAQPWRFFEVLQRCGALQRLLPEVSVVVGNPLSHQAGRETDAMAALKRAVELAAEPELRFAVVMYPAARIAQDRERFLRGLRVGKLARVQLEDLVQWLPRFDHGVRAASLLEVIKRLKPGHQPQRLAAFIKAAQSLRHARAVEIEQGLAMADEVVNRSNVNALRDAGLEGRALGVALVEQQLARLREKLVGDAD